MPKERKHVPKEQYASTIGTYFELLEPRLLLSGDWGAGVDAPVPDSPSIAPDGQSLESVARHEGSAVSRPNDRSVASGRANLLASAPALNSPPIDELNADIVANRQHGDLPNAIEVIPQELVFVDAGIENHTKLVDDLLAGAGPNREIDIIILEVGRDGVAQISDALSDRQDLSAVHFVTHGADGNVTLGAARLNNDNLEGYAVDISNWHKALAPQADLLFYGCDLAAGHDGRMLLNTIGTLTGADVAASDDLTGNHGLGGDWDLEYRVGEIESNATLSPKTARNWSGTLATFDVDTTADTVDINPGDGVARDASGDTSLRAAIMEANALAGADTINLLAGTYTLTRGPQGDDVAEHGDLDILSDMTISGAGAGSTTIDANGIDRAFHLAGNMADLTLTDLTVQGGSINGKGGGIYLDHNLSRLDASRVVITGNIADDGAGIFSDGSITFTDAVISNNGDAGTTEGGGIHTKENATLNRVTLSGNQANLGGGIHNDNAADPLSLTNVTISGNTAFTRGGGLHSQTAVSILNSTFTLNSAGEGGGIANNGGTINIRNTIIANNTAGNGPDIFGNITSAGHNIIGDTSDAGGFHGTDRQNTNPLLGALAANGGFGQTHALLTGSPAIDPAGLSGAPGLDQRGLARDATPDIGAYEFSAAGNNIGSVSIDNTTPVQGDTLTASVSDPDGASGAIGYQWYRNGTAITGATASSYTTGQADVGAVITVEASYTDDLGAAETPTSTATAAVTNVNDAPILGNNTLTIAEGMSMVLDSSMLSASDVDNPDPGLTFNISAVTGGRFERVSTGAAILTFTQADITAGEVRFVHFGGEAAPGYSVSIADGTAATIPVAAVINFSNRNDEPTMAMNTGMTVSEGTLGTIITTAMLNAVDPDDSSTGLTYTLTAVSANGVLRLNGTALGLNDTFTQDDIDNNRVTYDHDGSETLGDSFGFALADGGEDGATAVAGTFVITVTPVNDSNPVALNDAITLELGTTATTLDGGAASVLSNDSDADLPYDTISVAPGADPTHGTLSLNADGTFSYTHDGSSNLSDSFTYILSDANGGVTATGTVTVTVIAPPSAVGMNQAETYLEDTPLDLTDIVVTDLDSASVTVTLTMSDTGAGHLSTGTSGAVTATFNNGVWTAEGATADVNALLAGVTFTPAANHNGNFTIAVTVDDGATMPATGVKVMTGTPVGDTPQVTDIMTLAYVQSGLIIISPNIDDGAEVTHFRISGITNGTLYLADGMSRIDNGDFITVAQGQAGVRFTPSTDSLANGSFLVAASEDGASVAGQSGTAASVITVIPPASTPTAPPAATDSSASTPLPDATPEADLSEGAEETPVQESPETVAPARPNVVGTPAPNHRPSPGGWLSSMAQQMHHFNPAASADARGDSSDQPHAGDQRVSPRAMDSSQQQDLRSRLFNALSARAYLNMANGLDHLKEEVALDNKAYTAYLGPAIVSTVGLSAGYVVWLIRGGMLVSSLLSSLPAWQILDPLPILARKRGEDSTDDDESLASIVDRKPHREDKKRKHPRVSTDTTVER